MDVAKYRRLFLDESREHLQLLNRELLRLEQEGEAYDGVDALFRSAHSVKGMAGSMGYDAMASLSHALEDVLDRLRTRNLSVTAALVALLYEGVDSLSALANEIEAKGATDLDISPIAARLRAAAKGEAAASPPQARTAAAAAPPAPAPQPAVEGVAPEAPAPPVPAAGPSAPAEEGVALEGGVFALEPERIAQVLDFIRSGLVPYACRLSVERDSPALAARVFVILGRLGKAGMLLASDPTLADVRAGRCRDAVEALLLTERPEDQLRALLLAIPEVRELRLQRLHVGPGPGAREEGGGTSVLVAPREATVDRPAGAVAGLADRYAPRKAATVRVDTRVLDDLINIVGELIITRERLFEIARPLASDALDESLERLGALVRRFKDSIMTVRMMPLDLVTERLPRLVRDLAHQMGRQVSFEVAGKGIELDRAILEELGDVLIHLVRNAIDHGVEPPQQRVAAGKAAKAAVRIRAGRDRDWVWIRVEDDGRGMDPDRVARAAVERGVVTAEKAAALTPQERLLLSCLPGVSTAERVTGVSGRGVGMDAVKAKVESFGGALGIESRPGRGTAITLRLPLTLAIVRILLVEVAGQVFGLPVTHVLRTAARDPAAVSGPAGRQLLRWEGRLLPLVDLGGLLGLRPAGGAAGGGGFVAVAESGERAAAFAVDRLLGTWEIVIKPLGPPLDRVRGLAGVTVMADGRTVVLLDVPGLLER